MIKGVGIDIVDVARMEERIRRHSFIDRVFTRPEIEGCQDVNRSAECFAGKFAVKEAFMKAIGAGIRQGLWFKDVEVINDPNGAPHIETSGKASELRQELEVESIHISICHSGGLAIGLVILEG